MTGPGGGAVAGSAARAARAAVAAVVPDVGYADLIGYGRLAWHELRAIVADSPAAWADYYGFHIGAALPADPPPYSHLWAWTDQWLIRARLDGANAVVGVLALAAEPAPAPPAKLRERVAYQAVQAHNWPPTEKRVGPIAPDVADRQVTLYLIAGPRPVTFVALPPHP